MTYRKQIRRLEKQLLHNTILKTGSLSRAAIQLEMTEDSLRSRLKWLGIAYLYRSPNEILNLHKEYIKLIIESRNVNL